MPSILSDLASLIVAYGLNHRCRSARQMFCNRKVLLSSSRRTKTLPVLTMWAVGVQIVKRTTVLRVRRRHDACPAAGEMLVYKRQRACRKLPGCRRKHWSATWRYDHYVSSATTVACLIPICLPVWIKLATVKRADVHFSRLQRGDKPKAHEQHQRHRQPWKAWWGTVPRFWDRWCSQGSLT